ncbi:MAG TPA: molybdopterin cofactor-binding domain-containing protein, partial [Verrucomicrobiae bacterium]|nr:molybdopterin cofactor-binding domain-containing protein [Verrucomicrobiae bacterium]
MTKVIGGRVTREEAWGKVLGQTKFPADLSLPGQIHGVVVRSPHPHARVRKISLDRVCKMDGVVVTVTAEDLSNNSHGVLFRDQPVLVKDRVRMVGDPVAAIGAESPEIARRAAALVEIEYELLPAVFDPEEGMRPDCPPLHPEVHGNSNVIYHLPITRGDMNLGWEMADVIVEQVYSTQMVDHAFLQPEAVLVEVDERGHLVVQVATQYPHYDRGEIAHALGLKLSQVQVKTPAVGGAFGGREDISLQIIAAALAYKSMRPVKLENTREES